MTNTPGENRNSVMTIQEKCPDCNTSVIIDVSSLNRLGENVWCKIVCRNCHLTNIYVRPSGDREGGIES